MLDLEAIRSRFPALASGDVILDNPGGTQVPRAVTDRIVRYLHETNANHGGAFPTSRASDEVVAGARSAVADFLGAARPEEIAFGPNMTTLTFQMARSLSREWKPGDEIVLTRLDHDANVSPWLLAAADRGATVRWLDFDPADCTWNVEHLRSLVCERTKLVAVGWASNSVGTVNDVAGAAEAAHAAGALLYVDAVHYAPHGPIDVALAGADFLACSAYKFFGPHLGILWGRYDLLERTFAYKVRPAGDAPPDRWETGTQSFEAIAGTLGALEYLAWVGESFGGDALPALAGRHEGRRLALASAMTAIRAYEATLSRALLEALDAVPGLAVRGLTDPLRFDERVPTFSFTLSGHSPRAIAEELGRRGFRVWDGNYYAVGVTERLGLEGTGGMVRVGAVHYNTPEEIHRLGTALREIARS
ncbi:MAG: cysteine desulfurase-like protein [Holophagales bacterium]|nr:cysteine desulfurase-like protein [Holophagales bacterium]